jgi:hypothetical protein
MLCGAKVYALWCCAVVATHAVSKTRVTICPVVCMQALWLILAYEPPGAATNTITIGEFVNVLQQAADRSGQPDASLDFIIEPVQLFVNAEVVSYLDRMYEEVDKFFVPALRR